MVPNPNKMSLEQVAIYLRSKNVPSEFVIELVGQIFETRRMVESAIQERDNFLDNLTGVN